MVKKVAVSQKKGSNLSHHQHFQPTDAVETILDKKGIVIGIKFDKHSEKINIRDAI